MKTTHYDDGEHKPTEKRVVIPEPKPDRSGFLRVDMPKGTDANELK